MYDRSIIISVEDRQTGICIIRQTYRQTDRHILVGYLVNPISVENRQTDRQTYRHIVYLVYVISVKNVVERE